MKTEKKITCIICPIGCKIIVKNDETHQVVLKGNKCKKGIEYARNEVFDPRRMITTSVLVKHGNWPLVSVRSSQPIPKEKIFSVLKTLKEISINAPVECGEIIMKNVANSKINIIATKTIKKVEK